MNNRRLIIAVGNPLRGDDAVAHRVADLLGPDVLAAVLRVTQLTPELAAELAGAGEVVFLDASATPQAAGPRELDPAARSAAAGASDHHLAPETLVAMAHSLYGFTGRAFVYPLCARSFEVGASLSAESEAAAQQAAELLGRQRRISTESIGELE